MNRFNKIKIIIAVMLFGLFVMLFANLREKLGFGDSETASALTEQKVQKEQISSDHTADTKNNLKKGFTPVVCDVHKQDPQNISVEK